MHSKVILRVDASALKESACTRRFYWNCVAGYRARLNTNDIEFGSAVHEFIRVMKCNPGRYDLAVKAAQDRYKVPMEQKPDKVYMTAEYLTKTCMNFWQQWVEKDDYQTLVVNGQPLVEQKFSYPYYVDDVVEVLLCGTIDDLCQHKSTNAYGIRDYKTTSVYKKDQYLAGYMLSPQLMFYRLIATYYGRTYPESVLGQLATKGAACFIDGIFLQGASKPAEFKRSEIFQFNERQMLEFEKLVAERIQNLVKYVKADILPAREGMINGACQTVYGQCKYFGPCTQSDEVGEYHMLNRYFIQQEYNPLQFDQHAKS